MSGAQHMKPNSSFHCFRRESPADYAASIGQHRPHGCAQPVFGVTF